LGTIHVAHGNGPDSAADRPVGEPLGLVGNLEKEGEVRYECIYSHSPGQEILDIGESVGQGKGQLLHRAGTGLADMVAGYAQRIELPDPVVNEPFLHVPQQPYSEIGLENAFIPRLDLLEDVGLNGAAQLPEGLLAEFLAFLPCQPRSLSPPGALQFHLLCGHEIPGQYGPSRAVYCHGGADVRDMETLQHELHVLPAVDRNAPLADLADAPGVLVAVGPVEGDAVEGDREPRPGHPVGQQVESAIGLLGATHSGELARDLPGRDGAV